VQAIARQGAPSSSFSVLDAEPFLRWHALSGVRSVKDGPDRRDTDAVPSCQEVAMANNDKIRRDVLQALAILPLIGVAARAGEAAAQAAGSPVKVDTKRAGRQDKIRSSALRLLERDKWKVQASCHRIDAGARRTRRRTQPRRTGNPPGHVGLHDLRPAGQNSRLRARRFLFFESGDINHTVFNKTNEPMVHVLFEILPVDLNGPSLIPVKHH